MSHTCHYNITDTQYVSELCRMEQTVKQDVKQSTKSHVFSLRAKDCDNVRSDIPLIGHFGSNTGPGNQTHNNEETTHANQHKTELYTLW